MSYAVRVAVLRWAHSDTLKYTTLPAVTQQGAAGSKTLFGSVQNPRKLGLSIATRSGRINNQERPYRPAWTTANEVWTVGTTTFYTTFARTRTNLLDIPGRSTAAESTELYYGAVLTTMASFSTASFFQMSCNTALGQPIDFLRDVSELVELPRVITENARQRAQSQIMVSVALCQRKRAYVPAHPRRPFDGGSPLASSRKLLVYGAEALKTAARPLPREVVRRICFYV